ncbi:MAG: hypothetical protein IT265_15910 [Saprospiraceae bacterium]|nr:hypothetical protein [Saprospiraceae bacterium]
MTNSISFEELHQNLGISPKLTRLQHDEAVNQFIGAVVEFRKWEIADIGENSTIVLKSEDPRINVKYDNIDLIDKKLNQFYRMDKVRLLAQITRISIPYYYHTEANYPNIYDLKLISIKKL